MLRIIYVQNVSDIKYRPDILARSSYLNYASSVLLEVPMTIRFIHDLFCLKIASAFAFFRQLNRFYVRFSKWNCSPEDFHPMMNLNSSHLSLVGILVWICIVCHPLQACGEQAAHRDHGFSNSNLRSNGADEASNRQLDSKRPNLLFLVAESMRSDDLSVFNGVQGTAPNLEAFFSRPGSILVDQAHADYPLCNPSRTSLLLGRSPDSTGIKTNYLDWKSRPNATSWKTLPRFLKDQGYVTMLGGKVFHRGTNDPEAWSSIFNAKDSIDFAQCRKDRRARRVFIARRTSLPYAIGCRTASASIPDMILADSAAKRLAGYKRSDNASPFAMFVGFYLTHFPLRVQQQHLSPAANLTGIVPDTEPVRNASDFNVTYSVYAPKHYLGGENPDGRESIPESIKGGTAFTGPGATKEYRVGLRRLHLSGLRQLDSAIRLIIRGLDSLNYTSSTLVVFVADHGFAYGETRLWEKDLPLDIATRIPLMFRAPWLQTPARHTGPSFFMNSLSVYRTVAGFLQLDVPNDQVVEGRDYSTYFTRLAAGLDPSPASHAAFSQVVRCSVPSTCRGGLEGIDVVGYTVRTRLYRYVVYFHAEDGFVRDFSRSNVIAEELYDHSNDDETLYRSEGATLQGMEFRNIAPDRPGVVSDDLFDIVQNRSR